MEQMKFKIGSPEQSARLQKVLFDLGYKWASYGDTIKFVDMPCIYSDQHGFMTYSCGEYFYNKDMNSHKETDTEQFIELNTNKSKRHPQADLVHAWAEEGFEVEFLNRVREEWDSTKTPSWNPKLQFRRKPNRVTKYQYAVKTTPKFELFDNGVALKGLRTFITEYFTDEEFETRKANYINFTRLDWTKEEFEV